MSIQMMRLAIAAVGIVVWIYGQRVDSAEIRLFGIAMLAVSVLLRFARRNKPPAPPDE